MDYTNTSLTEVIKKEAKEKLVEKAQLIIDGDLDIIEGLRLILSLSNRAGIQDNDILLPIIGFVSQTDYFPIGEARDQCDPEYLQKLDKEKTEFIKDFKSSIVDTCIQIVKKYS